MFLEGVRPMTAVKVDADARPGEVSEAVGADTFDGGAIIEGVFAGEMIVFK